MADIPEIDGYADLVRVARGGFAVVYRARQDRFDRVVALKVLSIDELDDRSRRRFERECRAMGSLSWHPNVVAVIDSGIADGHPWLAMEYLDAGSLAARLEREGPLPWAEVVDIGVQVASALGAAHASGVLHRDLKPDNLLVGPFGEAKLADFGIAAVEGGTRTTTGSASFTVAHVAPEILEGRPPEEPSDVYGLASTLYTLIAGSPPFTGQGEESIATLITRILQKPAPRLTAVPDALADLIERSLAKDPAARPSTAAELGRALQAIQADHGTTPTALRLSPTSSTSSPSSAVDTTPPIPVDEPADKTLAVTPTAAPGDDAPADEVTVVRRPTGDLPPPATGDEPDRSPTDGTDPVTRGASRRRRAVGVGLVGLLAAAGAVAVITRDDSGARPPQVAGTIGVGRDPRDVVVTDGALWVTAYEDNTLERIDTDTEEAADTGLGTNGPQGLASGGGSVWVANYSDGTVSRIDPETGQSTETIDVGSSPQDITATDDAVWVSQVDNTVTRIDIGTLEVSDPLAVDSGPQGISATPDAVWVASVVEDTLSRIDPDTLTVAEVIPVGGGPIGVVATEEAVWVALSGEAAVARVDPTTGQVVATVPVGHNPSDLTLADGAVWVTNADDDTVSRIDTETNAVTDTLDVGDSPLGIAAGDDAVWVADADDDTVTRIDDGSNG